MTDLTLYETVKEVYNGIPFYIKAGLVVLTIGGGLVSRMIHGLNDSIKNYDKNLEKDIFETESEQSQITELENKIYAEQATRRI